jgi:hypothetical protein
MYLSPEPLVTMGASKLADDGQAVFASIAELRAAVPPRIVVEVARLTREETSDGTQLFFDKTSVRVGVTKRVPPRASGQFSPDAITIDVADA